MDITEEPNRIFVRLRFDKYGDFGDDKEISNWMLPLFERYDNDHRPIVMDNPSSGQTAAIFGDESHALMVVQDGNQADNGTQSP